MRKFELSDYYDLLNLHKALMEAKFHDNPDNEYISGSPITVSYTHLTLPTNSRV
mgnify:CR=1 FL=1